MSAPRFIRRTLALFGWARRDADMSEEMRHHLALLTEELVRAGMTRDAAITEAHRRFGSVLRMKEAGHDERRAPLVEHLVRDARHMARGLARSPGFAAAVILTLGVGIGGNTAIFSVVDQVLLRPLPYPDGDRLVVLFERFDSSGPSLEIGRTAPCNCVSPANWLDWGRDNRTLTGIAVWRNAPVTLVGVGEPVRLNNQLVSGEFFPVLGVRPLLGRTINANDDRTKMARVAVISHRLWQQRFGASPEVIGRSVQMNGAATEIIGVMPESFRFLFQDNDVWTPMQLDRTIAWRQTAGRFLDTVARIKPDRTLAAAQADLGGIAERLAATFEFNKRTGVRLVPLRQELTGQVQVSLLVLYAAVGVLFSIACVNVANLLLVRGSKRGREIAVRTALGAGRAAIVRQLLVESLLLALAGGGLGIALAHWSLDALLAFAPPNLLRVPELTVDTRVLAYALGMSVITGIVCGMVPALTVGLRPIAVTLRAGGIAVTHATRLRQVLVVSQVALTVILLCGAGLLARTLLALNSVDRGFDKNNVLTMELSISPRRYDDAQRAEFYRSVLEQLRGIPGVEAAAASNSLPIVGSPRGGTGFHLRGTPEVPPNQQPVTLVRVVTPGYFRTLRIPVLRGREFSDADTASAGFVVNDAFAKAYFAAVEPLGAEMAVGMQRENPHLRIIGVVGDVSEVSVRQTAQPTVFYNEATMAEFAMTLMLRTSRPDATVGPAIAAIHRLDPNLPVTKVRTFESALVESLARERLNAVVSSGFALSGLLLAALGVYGLLAYIVAERTREIAIRVALGAHLQRLTRSVVGRGLRLVAIGAVLGVAGSLALLRSLRTLLFDVTPYDVPTYATVVALLCAVAAIASYVPARHAARVEPLLVLRDD
ncbi:MAG TPA: ABC transporter permease [Vicinamibacterales bacterium]|jgi:putative ABC transport system permease protein|nr:ABC transporter permease [Vicinamibacterales bacterium]